MSISMTSIVSSSPTQAGLRVTSGALRPFTADATKLIAADPAVLDFQAGHASPRTTVPAPYTERLMPVLGLERLCRDAPAMASTQPAERAEQEHGFEVSVPQSSGEGTDRAE